MATGFSQSIDLGSTAIYDIYCSPCRRNGSITEASKHCVECEESFCFKCLQYHAKFQMLKNHTVLDVQDGEIDHSSASPKNTSTCRSFCSATQKCQRHRGKIIDTFCGNHDVVCCPVCIAVSHRACFDVQFLSDAAKDIEHTKDLMNIKRTAKNLLSKLQKAKSDRKDDLRVIEEERNDVTTKISDFTKAIIKHFTDLEQSALTAVSTRFFVYETNIIADIETVEEQIKTVESSLIEMRIKAGKTAEAIFIDAVQTKGIRTTAKKVLCKVQKSIGQERLCFNLDKCLKDTIENMKSLGEITEMSVSATFKHSCEVSLLSQYNVKLDSDTSACFISGSCIMTDGTIVIADKANKKLKRLDQSFNVIDHCVLSEEPGAMCKTGPAEAAVILPQRIQFVSLSDQISLTRSFSIGENCYGVAYSNNKIYVNCGMPDENNSRHIQVYNTERTWLHQSGKLLTKIRLHNIRQGIFETETNVKKNEVHILIGKGGAKQCTFTDPAVRAKYGVCVADDNLLFVCKKQSVIQITKEGQKLGMILDETDGVSDPQSLCYDTSNSRLIVTMGRTNYIKVFKIVKG